MADAIFDGANLHITIPSTGTFNVQRDLYSAWKRWTALSDNAKYPLAFDTTGGDDVGGGQEVAPYFFCRNDLGWRIKMPTANGEVVLTEAQAAAITGISLNFSTETVTITQNTTSQQLYDYYQYQLAQTANMVYGEDLIRTGTAFNLDDWDMVIDGAEYTGDITTTGTITLQNGGLIIGTATDSVGTTTVTVLTLTGLQANSEVRVFNAGTTTEIAGVENSGTSFSANISANSVDIVVHSLGFEYQKIPGADTTSNLTLPIQQRVDRNYSNP